MHALVPGPSTVAQVDERDWGWGKDRDNISHSLQTALLADPWFQANQQLFMWRNGLTWKGSKICVPESQCLAKLWRSHDAQTAGDFRFLKTLHLTNRQFWWLRMKKDLEDYVLSCPNCATIKRQGNLLPLTVSCKSHLALGGTGHGLNSGPPRKLWQHRNLDCHRPFLEASPLWVLSWLPISLKTSKTIYHQHLLATERVTKDHLRQGGAVYCKILAGVSEDGGVLTRTQFSIPWGGQKGQRNGGTVSMLLC